MTTRAEAIDAAAEVLANALIQQSLMTVEEAARAAWTPTGPSIPELEAAIRADREALKKRERAGMHPNSLSA